MILRIGGIIEMKRTLSLLLAGTLATSLSVPALAVTGDTLDESKYYIQCGTWTEEDQMRSSGIVLNDTFEESDFCIHTGTWDENNASPKLGLPNTEPRYEDSFVTSKALTINVDVNSPLEKEWRSTYSNYYYEADRIIEKIDDYLYDEFGIDLYTKSQPHWSFSTSATGKTAAIQAIEDAIAAFGEGDADIMIAFAGPIGDVGRKAVFGITQEDSAYCLLLDHEYYQNCKSTQHEVGHVYGLGECKSSSACVMRQGEDTEWNLFNHLCSRHHSQWDDAKDLYGG